MNPGYIYILQNKAYGPYVIKIGLSKRIPDVRAREIYAGATGVPLPFDIAIAFSVEDCKAAEKIIHKRLAAYRLNNRREFFRMSPSVASAIALETCSQVNASLGVQVSETLSFPPVDPAATIYGTVVDRIADESDGIPVEWIAPDRLSESAIGTSTLTPEELDRARILHMVLSKVTDITDQRWFDTFSQDENPVRELRIWEHIAKAYLCVEGIDLATDGLKKEAYHLLLQRSWSPTAEVLNGRTPQHMSYASAKRLLDGYGLKPKTFIIRRSAVTG